MKCKTCGTDCTEKYMMCAQEVGFPSYCLACFEKTPCGRGEHSEACPTLVADGYVQPMPNS
jgi:hypothetical protein